MFDEGDGDPVQIAIYSLQNELTTDDAYSGKPELDLVENFFACLCTCLALYMLIMLSALHGAVFTDLFADRSIGLYIAGV